MIDPNLRTASETRYLNDAWFRRTVDGIRAVLAHDPPVLSAADLRMAVDLAEELYRIEELQAQRIRRITEGTP